MNLCKTITSLSFTAAFLLLSGCGIGTLSVPSAVPGTAFKGSVHGGQQPVVGVTLQLYAVGSTGYGTGYIGYSGGPSLLSTNVVTTDATGSFNITEKYECPTGNTMVYLVGTGGTPVVGQGANANLAMMAALGRCGDLSASTFVSMNELTTVAAVWALAPFMTDAAHIGAPSTNALGLVNAFASARKLVDTSTGTVSGPGLPADAVLPVAEINTLGNILAACVNTSGTTGGSTPCGDLFGLTQSTLGATPTDTIASALNIALTPAHNAAQLNALPTPQAPFQPGIGATAPAAWTIAIRYPAGGHLSAPMGIATDLDGSIWIANSGAPNVTKLDTNGVLQSGATGFGATLTGPASIAIDQAGNAWTPGVTVGSLVKLSSSGTPTSYLGTNLGTINSIAIDAQGFIWAASTGGLSAFNTSGTEVSGGGYTGGGISGPTGVAISPR